MRHNARPFLLDVGDCSTEWTVSQDSAIRWQRGPRLSVLPVRGALTLVTEPSPDSPRLRERVLPLSQSWLEDPFQSNAHQHEGESDQE
jgi:hypothetical protein